MDTVLRFSWDGVSIATLQGQVNPNVILSKAGPVPGTLLDIILTSAVVTAQDEDDVKNAMTLLGWTFLEKNPSSL
jgi:hypothetical protein